MRLVQAVLNDIEEHQPLMNQGDFSVALIGLAEACNTFGEQVDHYTPLTEHSTGAQLKLALEALRLKDQVALLQTYRAWLRAINKFSSSPIPLESSHDPLTSTKERIALLEAEERIRFRSRARWILLLTFAPIPPLIVGAMVAVSWYKGIGMDSAVVKGIVATASEMLKLIFTI